MSRTPDKTAKRSSDRDLSRSDEPKDCDNLELPDPGTVEAEISFVSPKGKTYQIIRTSERDEYEEPLAEKKRRRSGQLPPEE